MAKKKQRKSASRKSARVASFSKPQNWFLDLGRDRAAELSRLAQQKGDPPWSRERVNQYARLKRISASEYIKDAVLGKRDPETQKRSGGLRDYFEGFETSDGFDMRHPENLPAAKARSIRKYATYLHTLQAQPHIKVSPKSVRMKRALQERTGQYNKRQKAFVYHTEKPKVTTVTYKEGALEEKQKITAKTTIIRRYYFFRDYNEGVQPKTFEEMLRIAEEEMLDEMPDVYYTLWTDLNGSIGAPFPKSSALKTLNYYEAKYGTHEGFAEGVLGFAFQGTSDQADSEYVNRLNRRMVKQQQKTQQARINQERLRFLAQSRRSQTRRCEVIGRGGRCHLRRGHKGRHRFGESKK